MPYLVSSIREAMSMTKPAIIAELQHAGLVYGWQGASKDQLISLWLEKYGTKELVR